jgi:hypothetical protein
MLAEGACQVSVSQEKKLPRLAARFQTSLGMIRSFS